MLLYSGRKDNEHQAGVAILIKGEVSKSMIEWKPINERIITARFHSRFAKLTTIVCYVPTEDVQRKMRKTTSTNNYNRSLHKSQGMTCFYSWVT